MSSVSSQPHSPYTQPPSKVLHLRNLPWVCAEEELIELGKPFGMVVATRCNAGPNHDQAFIEFADLNQAIAMISYYASSSEPAQVRGKNVYLQYSNRKEIVNAKTTIDVAGNVLLATIEGEDSRLVCIDVLHLVFSAFGFVHKIITFEKTAGFQALVQFSDTETASSAKNALDGRIIPRYLLLEHMGQCSLRITYSAYTDLSVNVQSHWSRDYTNRYLPIAPSAMDGSSQITMGLKGSNVLLASFENMQYTVTLEVLHTVFSAIGHIQKIVMFDKNGGVQALIQYPDVQTAVAAKEALEGHCIYDGGFCKLRISYSHLTDLYIKTKHERSRDYTQPGQMTSAVPHHYNGTQFAPTAEHSTMPHQPWSGWVPPEPQPMSMQMNNQQPYMTSSGWVPPEPQTMSMQTSNQQPYMPSSAWIPPGPHQTMPMQMNNQQPYMPPSGSMPPRMMPRPNHGGQHHGGAMPPPYRHHHTH